MHLTMQHHTLFSRGIQTRYIYTSRTHLTNLQKNHYQIQPKNYGLYHFKPARYSKYQKSRTVQKNGFEILMLSPSPEVDSFQIFTVRSSLQDANLRPSGSKVKLQTVDSCPSSVALHSQSSSSSL